MVSIRGVSRAACGAADISAIGVAVWRGWREGLRAKATEGLRARNCLAGFLALVVEGDPEPLGHSIERSPIDAEDFGGARSVAADGLEHVKQVAALELLERRQILEQPFLERRRRDDASPGRSWTSIRPRLNTTRRSMVFSSSRTLPGQR